MKKAILGSAVMALGVVVGLPAAASAADALGNGPLGLITDTDVYPSIIPAGDTVMNAARGTGFTKGSAFDREPSRPVSGVYLDGLDHGAAKEAAVPFSNPVGPGSVQAHPLNAATAAGLGSLLGR